MSLDDASPLGQLPRLLTLDEVADILRVARGTVRGLLRSGSLRGGKIGPKLWRISREDLEEYLRGLSTEAEWTSSRFR
jgi:excisionase family DNA binding protein